VNVGICRVTLRLPENHSLKGKRQVIGSLCARIRNKFNVSVAEVDDNDLWQVATLGISCVSNSARHADEVLSSVTAFIEDNRGDLELMDIQHETMSGL
jgi:hypothetical protein